MNSGNTLPTEKRLSDITISLKINFFPVFPIFSGHNFQFFIFFGGNVIFSRRKVSFFCYKSVFRKSSFFPLN